LKLSTSLLIFGHGHAHGHGHEYIFFHLLFLPCAFLTKNVKSFP
jgi:hypothetical protein